MITRIFMTEKERMQPFGHVIINKPMHTFVPVKMWDNFLKSWEVTNEREDPEHIVAEDLTTISAGCCIHCHNKIKPYSNKYYEKGIDESYEYSFLKSEETGYCEKCAKEITAYATISKFVPSLSYSERTYRDGEQLERKVYTDGSVVEELSQREIAQQKHL